MHSHTTPRRPVRKPLLVLFVHLGEIGHIDQKHIDLDDPVEAGPGGREHGGEVGDAAAGFVGDGAGDEGAGGVGGDLARAVDCCWGADGLGLRW